MQHIKHLIVATALLVSWGALAVDLSLDQSKPILMPDGKTQALYCDAWSSDPKPICQHQSPKTVGSVIQGVMLAQFASPQGMGQDPSNAKSGAIAIRVYDVPKPVLKLPELTLILERVDRGEDPITIARMHEFLEPLLAEPAK